MVSVGGEDSDDEAYPLRFGCQTDITGLFEDQIPDGIFGMNKEKGSAISQWSKTDYLEAPAFSLCYNVREDVEKKSGIMVLGGTDERLHDTPMVYARDVGSINYEVRIKNIHLKRGPGLDASAFVNNTVSLGLDGTDTATLDSGTTCSFLHPAWYESLQNAWQQTTHGQYSMFSHLSINATELNELPTIIFELQGEKENETITVDYPPIRYMEKNRGGGYDFCMQQAFGASDVTLGNTFMSGHDVLHDLDNKRIGFAQSKCEIHEVSEVGNSIESDADKESSSKPKIKPIALQSDPIHKREQDPAKTPFMVFIYVVVAIGVVALGLVLYRRHRSIKEGGNVEPLTFTSLWVEPSTKHAYQLSCISLIATVLAIIAGVALFLVSFPCNNDNEFYLCKCCGFLLLGTYPDTSC